MLPATEGFVAWPKPGGDVNIKRMNANEGKSLDPVHFIVVPLIVVRRNHVAIIHVGTKRIAFALPKSRGGSIGPIASTGKGARKQDAGSLCTNP